MSTEVTQSVTSRRSDIPVGYIAISSFGCHKGNTEKKASEEYKALYQAWCDERISGIKLMKSVHDKRGQIFVDPIAAERVIAEHRQPRQKPKTLRSNNVSSAFSLRSSLASIDTTLDEICRVLERLTTAVENIATQPKTPQQEVMAIIGGNGSWRDMNGESH